MRDDSPAAHPPGTSGPPPAPDLAAQVRAMPWFLVGNLLNTIFCYWTFTGAVFLLFLDELGLPKSQIGGLLSLFPFCHVLALGFAPVATRWGWRRVFLIAYGLRKCVLSLLLLVPWVLGRWGQYTAVVFLFAVIIVFALLRAIAETAYYPWCQEFMPNSLRGKYSGQVQILSTVGGALAIWLAGVALGHGQGLGRYLWLIGLGCFLGFLGVLAMMALPGGGPRPVAEGFAGHRRHLVAAVSDGNFREYLLATGAVTLGSVLLLAFLPLYIKQQLAVPSGIVVTLEVAWLAGAALSGWLLGRAADRVGSRPVLLCSSAASLLVPLAWLLLPRHVPHAVVWCGLLYVVQGITASGIAIAAGRLLFNSVIPPAQSTAYTAIYYAWIGITGGLAPLLAGQILERCGTWQLDFGGVLLDGHAILFAGATLLLALGWWRYAKVRPDDPQRTRVVLRQLFEPTLRRLFLLAWR
jgi:MFS family permease